MPASSVLFHPLLLLVEWWLFRWLLLGKDRSRARIWLKSGCAAFLGAGWAVVVGLGVMVVAGDWPFGWLRLLDEALFLHGPAYLLVPAWMLARRGWRIGGTVFAALCTCLVAIGAHAHFKAPWDLRVERYRIMAPDRLGWTQPLRIVVVADLQTDVWGDYEVGSLEAALAEEPDLLLLPGDYIHAASADRPALRSAFRQTLLDLDFGAPIGAYAVDGNIDGPQWTGSFAGTRVKAMAGTSLVLEKNGQTIELTGLTSPQSGGHPRWSPPPKKVGDALRILLGHRPDFALDLRPGDYDLVVAGHMHGGQVTLPGVGPILTLSRAPRRWATGVHQHAGGWVAVSRGIGHERGAAPRIRFRCPPEIMVLDVEP